MMVEPKKDGTRYLAWFPDIRKWKITYWFNPSGHCFHWTFDGVWCPYEPVVFAELPEDLEH